MLLNATFTTLPLALILLITTATAFPFPSWPGSLSTSALPSATHHAAHLRKRGLPGAVYICTDDNFRGNCGWLLPSSSCRIPGTGAQKPRSVGPDAGGHCILFEKSDCTGKEILTLNFPGVGSALPDFGGLMCFADSTMTGQRTNVTETVPVKNDPRLAGGEGSAKGRRVKDQIKEMEKNGFRDGMIGLEKGIYY